MTVFIPAGVPVAARGIYEPFGLALGEVIARSDLRTLHLLLSKESLRRACNT